MGLRKSYLPWLACLAIGAIAVPALATGEERAPGQIHVRDNEFFNPVTGEPSVTINRGETVTFSFPDGGGFHNVNFEGPMQPSSCTLTGSTAQFRTAGNSLALSGAFPISQGAFTARQQELIDAMMLLPAGTNFPNELIQGTGTGTPVVPQP